MEYGTAVVGRVSFLGDAAEPEGSALDGLLGDNFSEYFVFSNVNSFLTWLNKSFLSLILFSSDVWVLIPATKI